MVRIMKKDGNRLEGIGERIAVRLTLLEEALGMTPGDPEIYGNWIASKAPEPEVGEEEVGVIEGMDAVEDATTCFPRTEDGVPFCWDYQIKGFFKDACSSLRRVPGTRSSKLTAFKKVIDGTVFVEQRKIPFQLPEGAECGRCERVFFKVDGDWYVDDVREADGAKAKRRERRRRDFYRNFSLRSFHPTKAFLDKWVRGMYGWKNVKPSDVVITRETCAEGIYYRVRKTVGKGDWFSVTSFGKR